VADPSSRSAVEGKYRGGARAAHFALCRADLDQTSWLLVPKTMFNDLLCDMFYSAPEDEAGPLLVSQKRP